MAEKNIKKTRDSTSGVQNSGDGVCGEEPYLPSMQVEADALPASQEGTHRMVADSGTVLVAGVSNVPQQDSQAPGLGEGERVHDASGQRVIIAIDPGKAGAIAFCWRDGSVNVENMPDGVNALAQFIEGVFGASFPHVRAYIERVHAWPGQGVNSCFTFGRGYGQIEGVLASNAVEIVDVTPQKWQKDFQLGRAKDHASKNAWKHHLRLAACRLYPDRTVTLQHADALLLLKYAMKQEGVS